MEFANKLKYERAKAESDITGQTIEGIYLRMGGKLTGVDAPKVVEAEQPVVSVENPELPKKETVLSKVKKAAKKIKK